jgi:hypothetical protein
MTVGLVPLGRAMWVDSTFSTLASGAINVAQKRLFSMMSPFFSSLASISMLTTFLPGFYLAFCRT